MPKPEEASMLRVTTANLNGIRSAARKNFFAWMLERDIDVLCVQETKAQEHQLADEIRSLPGYRSYFLDAEKPGYSGVAVFTRHEPRAISTGIGDPALDAEGRWLRLDFDAASITSAYFPSGTSGPHRQVEKDRFLEIVAPRMKQFVKSGHRHIVCGDLNIAHKPVDIKNWRANQTTSGFLPHERAWLDTLFDDIGMVDAFRVLDQRDDRYTWWSMRANARANNVGWRIDYHVVTPNLRDALVATDIAREPLFSDHAPLTIDYDIELARV